MKYVLSLVGGLLLGAGLAMVAIFFNPLTEGGSEWSAGREWTFSYTLSPSDVWLLSHARQVDIPVVPSDVPLLFEDGIRGVVVTSMPLTMPTVADAALATRISVPSQESELLSSGLLVEDFWLISVPGRGSVFVDAINNQWPLFRDTVVLVDWLKQSFDHFGEYDPTRGPTANGAAVFGLTGDYRNVRGSGRERLVLDSYQGSFGGIAGQLAIDLAATDGRSSAR